MRHRVKPYERCYGKVELRDLRRVLQREVHWGYVRFWMDRGLRPPMVSSRVVEDMDGLVVWAGRDK